VTLTHRVLGRPEAGPALWLLGDWLPAGVATNALHPGDLGWFLRHDDAECAGAILLWERDGDAVAVGLRDGPVLRLAQSPATLADRRVGAELARAVEAAVGPGPAWCDPPMRGAARDALAGHGWVDDDDPWPHLLLSLAEPPAWPPSASVVTGPDVDDRVLVQRSAFENSTFSARRWQLMRDSVAGQTCVDVLVRAPDGRPAAAATGWLAGPGRCGLLEPVGTHPDHRGQGHGRAAVLAAAAALAERGAGAVAVLTPASNTAGVALYTSAGFTVTDTQRSLHRP
jgi:ribosomal protein S18 acetylase RimI-like enzyme